MYRTLIAGFLFSLLFLPVHAAGQSTAWTKAVEQYERDVDSDDEKVWTAAILGLAGPVDAAILSFLETPVRNWSRFLEEYERKRLAHVAFLERLKTDLEGKDEKRKGAAKTRYNQTLEKLKKLEKQIDRLRSQKSAAVKALARVGTDLEAGAQAEYVKRIQHLAFKHREWYVRVTYVDALSRLKAKGVLDLMFDCIARSQNELSRLARMRKKKNKIFDQTLEKFAKRRAITTQDKMLQAQAEVNKITALEHGERRILVLAFEGVERQIKNMKREAGEKGLAKLWSVLGQTRAAEIRAGYFRTLAKIGGPVVRSHIREFAKKPGSSPDDQIAVAQALGLLKDTESIPVLVEMLKAREWAVRYAAIDALYSIGDRQVVGVLIMQLEKEEGRLREDLEEALEGMTGQRYGVNTALWKEWFAKHGDTFEVKSRPTGKDQGSGDEKKGGEVSSFYGIVTRSKNIVYVLDVSGSMTEEATGAVTKISRAKEELLQAVSSLGKQSKFNVVFYSDPVRRWQKKMVKGGASSSKKLKKTLDKLAANGATNTYGALMDALALAGVGGYDPKYKAHVDTIYFLSDGHPTVGAVLDPSRILEEVKSLNRLRRITIHSVGVGKNHNVDFMRKLAEENGGMYAAR